MKKEEKLEILKRIEKRSWKELELFAHHMNFDKQGDIVNKTLNNLSVIPTIRKEIA